MTIQDLFDRFPDLPKNALIKAELLVRGVKVGAPLERALSEYRQAAGSRPGANPPLVVNGTYVDIRPATDSPYEVISSDEGLLLLENDQIITTVNLPRPSTAMRAGSVDGLPFSEIASLSPDSGILTIQLLSGCEHALDGLACSFCSRTESDPHLDRSQEKMKLEVFAGVAAELLASDELRGVILTGGSMRDLDEEAVWLYEAVSRLRTVLPKDSVTISVSSQPLEPEGIEALVSSGIDQMDECADVLTETSRARDIPGKHRAQTENSLKDTARSGLKLLGPGAHTTSFIAGAQVIGSSSIQTDLGDLESGVSAALADERELIQALVGIGTVPRPIIWTPTKDSRWAADPRHVRQAPPSSYHLELAETLIRALENKGMIRDQLSSESLALSLRPDIHFHGLGLGDLL